jgi:hypothetical protein
MIAEKLAAILTNPANVAASKTEHGRERVAALHRKRVSLLSGLASFYTVLPADEWISVTKASIAAGGTSGMGQSWCVEEVRTMIRAGYVAERHSVRRQWIRPFDTAELLAWAQQPEILAHEGMDLETWKRHGHSWVEYMNR